MTIDHRSHPVAGLVLEVRSLFPDDLLATRGQFVPHELDHLVHHGELVLVEGRAALAFAVTATSFTSI